MDELCLHRRKDSRGTGAKFLNGLYYSLKKTVDNGSDKEGESDDF